MVGRAGSATGIVHADMTLTRSKVKVKVTGLLNFQQLAKPCILGAMTVSPLPGLSGPPMSIVAKRSPISATAEHLFSYAKDIGENPGLLHRHCPKIYFNTCHMPKVNMS